MGFFDKFRKKSASQETQTVKIEEYEKYILVVDDAPFLRKVVRNELTRNGYDQIVEAENGEKAVTAFKANRPYLVITDLTMPFMDGIEACRAMREIDPTVPVIICFGTIGFPETYEAFEASAKPILEEAFESGAKAILSKPFSMEKLVQAVKYALDGDPQSSTKNVFITYKAEADLIRAKNDSDN